MSRWSVGDVVAERELVDLNGTVVRLPGGPGLTHLQLRRFAGCPVCNLHLRSIVRRHDEVLSAGVREVVVFHSRAEELRRHTADLPFAVIADPTKRLYVEFGAESGRRALLDPRVWLPILRGVAASLVAIIRRRGAMPAQNPEGGRLGLPADLLIGPDGRVVAVRYGEHAYDQWSVDELLTLARTASAADRADGTARDRAPA